MRAEARQPVQILYDVVDTAVECVSPHNLQEEKELEQVFDASFRLPNIFSSQDFQQKANMAFNVTVELYRVLVSSMLVVFVPQKCGDTMCSIIDTHRYHEDSNLFAILCLNFVTMFFFVIMYSVEIKREERFIRILEVNKTISTDNDSVGKRIAKLPPKKQKQLFDVDRYYRYTSCLATVVFAVNSALSANIIQKASLGNQTLFNLITNVLFMVSKVTNVWYISNTGKNVFLSAYLNTKVQFNDLDPREYEHLRKAEVLREIERTGGRNLLEPHLQLLESGGFEIDLQDTMTPS